LVLITALVALFTGPAFAQTSPPGYTPFDFAQQAKLRADAEGRGRKCGRRSTIRGVNGSTSTCRARATSFAHPPTSTTIRGTSNERINLHEAVSDPQGDEGKV